MPLFNFYIMVDWSGAGSRAGNRPDSIWIAFGGIEDEDPETASPFSRTEAVQIIRELLLTQMGKGHRVLLCFDLAYGFPRDFAAALQTAIGKGDDVLPWRFVWEYLKSEVEDDGGEGPSRRPSNRSNRFEVASKINSLLAVSSEAAGPFWCAPAEGRYPYLSQKRPPQPFQSAQGFLVRSMRFADQRARSGTPFRLSDMVALAARHLQEFHDCTNSVSLPSSRHDRLSGRSRPVGRTKRNGCPKTLRFCMAKFIRASETPWRIRLKTAVKPDRCGDGHGIRTARSCFGAEFARPIEIDPASPEDIAIQVTEGWILGCSPTARNQ
jgi:hypothetical protein